MSRPLLPDEGFQRIEEFGGDTPKYPAQRLRDFSVEVIETAFHRYLRGTTNLHVHVRVGRWLGVRREIKERDFCAILAVAAGPAVTQDSTLGAHREGDDVVQPGSNGNE